METRRQTAIRARASDIVNSKFVRKEGLEPSYVITDLGLKISRAKITGTIIDKFSSDTGTLSSITIADDSGSVRAKTFQDNIDAFDSLEIGDTITVIGRVREYNEENYLIPEIIRKVVDPNHETLHKLEVLQGVFRQRQALEIVNREKGNFSDLEELKNYLTKEYGISQGSAEGILEMLAAEEPSNNENYKEAVIKAVEKLDDGNGVEIRKLMEETKLPNGVFEEVINDVLAEGICYESSPGIIRLA